MYEYKTVGGPEKGRKLRGTKTASDRAAVAMQEIISAEAALGWEYLRTDLVPIEDRKGLLSRPQQIHCAVLVFRRPLQGARPGHAAAMPADPVGRREPVLNTRVEPRVEPRAELRRHAPPPPPVLGAGLGNRIDDND